MLLNDLELVNLILFFTYILVCQILGFRLKIKMIKGIEHVEKTRWIQLTLVHLPALSNLFDLVCLGFKFFINQARSFQGH